ASFGVAISTTNIFDGAWHHIAGIKRGVIAEIWVDGNKQDTDNINANFTDDGAFAIGRDGQCCEYFNGLMDEAKIWNRALSQDEIQAEIATALRPDKPIFSAVPAPARLYPYTFADIVNGPYTVVVDFTDPDGPQDLQHVYLQITGDGAPQTIMYSG